LLQILCIYVKPIVRNCVTKLEFTQTKKGLGTFKVLNKNKFFV